MATKEGIANVLKVVAPVGKDFVVTATNKTTGKVHVLDGELFTVMPVQGNYRSNNMNLAENWVKSRPDALKLPWLDEGGVMFALIKAKVDPATENFIAWHRMPIPRELTPYEKWFSGEAGRVVDFKEAGNPKEWVLANLAMFFQFRCEKAGFNWETALGDFKNLIEKLWE